ncbi:MAG TPA: enolase C-terminal domain-like protein [Candidatus Limnocylindrales bacterium]
MRITNVETIRVPAPAWAPAEGWTTSPLDAVYEDGDRDRARAMGVYNGVPDLRSDPVFTVIVRVTTEGGQQGLGGIALGSSAVADVVDHHLRPLVLGASVFDTELAWERMYRSTINIGRKGLVLEAISGVDIAIWDALGKVVGQPVYNLLGGRTRQRIRAYCSAGHTTASPDDMARRARERMDRYGLTGFKMWFGYGPRDGRPGMRRNLDCVRALRDALGDDVDLMGDAYMGWNVPYAIEMIRMLEPFHLTWIEEPVIPDDVAGYARIRSAVGTPIAGGEHEFTRWGFRALIQAGAVDYLQPDVNRMGGITEARKVWALAQAHDLEVIPHSHNFHNLHLVISHLNSPLAEFFPSEYVDGDTFFSTLFSGEAEVRDGHITLSERPGFGVELRDGVAAGVIGAPTGGTATGTQ